jgi:hypothetical protein
MSSEVGNIFADSDAISSSVADAILRSPLILIAYLGLWGVDLYVLRYYNLDYTALGVGGDKSCSNIYDSDDDDSDDELQDDDDTHR